MDPRTARILWATAEPLHAIVYFSPEARAATENCGLRGFWRGYFAGRAAPLGGVGAGVVTAAFFNFAPAMVARAVPEVWSLAPPARAWEARLAGAEAALAVSLPDDGETRDAVAEAADLAVAAVTAAPVEGRVLGAAHAAMPRPDTPVLVLWQALTALRELRGDGHNAALLSAGLDGCAAHVLMAAAGGTARDVTQPHRGWTDADWDGARAALASRGLIAADGRATTAGHALRTAVEDATDRAALPPLVALGADRTERLRALLAPLSARLVERAVVTLPNPIGAPWPPPEPSES